MVNTSKRTDRTLRRAVNACSRCRQHKIKCSGECPCSNCVQRNSKCTFSDEGKKIQVSKKQLSDLYRRNCDLEKENRALQQQLSNRQDATGPAERSGLLSPVDHVGANSYHSSPLDRLIESRDENEQEENGSHIVNPLSCGPPEYIMDRVGKPHYLGHTSTWSLTIRLLHLTHHALYKCPFPSADLHIDSMTYDLQWNGLRSPAIPDVRGLPSLDHALFLINATKFHTGQIFHLFHEPTFMAQLNHFYEDPETHIHTSGLWFIHFLVIIALGKAFVGTKARGKSPPGAEYFIRAFMMLPDYSFLLKDACTSAEVLCAFALYLQSVDWRTSAHNMIGQASRMLQIHGYHTNVASRFTNAEDLLRCQKIWWTVYVLERQMSVLMGAPLGISESDISALLPTFSDSHIKTTTVAIHVKLSQAFSQVVNALYRESGHSSLTFVKSTQEVLQRVADVAPDLREHFPVPEKEAVNGISRVAGYMNLLYHQCIMLATRPFLFILVEMSVKSDTLMEVPTPIQLLLQICLESAKKSIFILSALQDQSLLECFLPFDLESAVSTGLVITMASLVSPSLIESHTSYLTNLSNILDHMVEQGNLIAADQKTELIELERLCASLKLAQHQDKDGDASAVPLQNGHNAYPEHPQAGILIDVDGSRDDQWQGDILEPTDWARDMSPSQILEVVDMLNGENLLDWVDLPSNALGFGADGDF